MGATVSDDLTFTDDLTPLDADDQLDDVESTVEDAEEGIPTGDPPLYPLGRSYAYDLRRGGFIPFGAGPLQTSGLDTLRYWVEKTLLTARGVHPIYSDEYGIDDPTASIGEPMSAMTASENADLVAEALTQHPRIDSVDNFVVSSEEDADFLVASFDVRVSGPEGTQTLSFSDVEVNPDA